MRLHKVLWTDRDGFEHEVTLSQRFRLEVTQDGTASCWVYAWTALHEVVLGYGLCDCEHQVDAHHLIAKQRIKAEFPKGPARDLIVWDPRNGVPVCRKHHDLLEKRRILIPREELPASVEEFADAYGLAWVLEREYGPREVAA